MKPASFSTGFHGKLSSSSANSAHFGKTSKLREKQEYLDNCLFPCTESRGCGAWRKKAAASPAAEAGEKHSWCSHPCLACEGWKTPHTSLLICIPTLSGTGFPHPRGAAGSLELPRLPCTTCSRSPSTPQWCQQDFRICNSSPVTAVDQTFPRKRHLRVHTIGISLLSTSRALLQPSTD